MAGGALRRIVSRSSSSCHPGRRLPILRRRWGRTLSACALLLLTSGCAGTKQKPQVELPPPPSLGVPPAYVIQPYDLLDIRFFHNPDFDEEVQVRPDGRFSLPLAHEVMAQGLNPEELTSVLEERD